jgi:hypothetical protein
MHWNLRINIRCVLRLLAFNDYMGAHTCRLVPLEFNSFETDRGWMARMCFTKYPWVSYGCTEYIAVILVTLSPLGTAATTDLLYHLQMIDDDDCGAIGGMKIGRGNRSTRRKPLLPPQIPHDHTRTRTQAEYSSNFRRPLSFRHCVRLTHISPLHSMATLSIESHPF